MLEACAGISLLSRLLLLLTNINHILAVICRDNYVADEPYFDNFYHFKDYNYDHFFSSAPRPPQVNVYGY